MDLSVNSEDSVHPPNKQLEQLKYLLPFAFVIVLALIITEYQVRPNSGAQTFWLLGTTVVIFLMIRFLVLKFDDTEPLFYRWHQHVANPSDPHLNNFSDNRIHHQNNTQSRSQFRPSRQKRICNSKPNPNLKALFPDNSRMPEGKILKQIAESLSQDKSAKDQKGGDSSILKPIFTVIFVVVVVVTATALPEVMSLAHTPLFTVLVVLTLLGVISFRFLTELEGQELLAHPM